jgi:hypothetical protein
MSDEQSPSKDVHSEEEKTVHEDEPVTVQEGAGAAVRISSSDDAENLHEDSSDSIEVIDPDKNPETQSITTLTAGAGGSGEVSPMKASAAAMPDPQPGPAQEPPQSGSDELMQRLLSDLQAAPTRYENIYDSSDYPSAEDEEPDLCINRPDSLSLPRPLQYYEKRKKVNRGMSESSMSTSSSVDALIEEVSRTPLSSQGTVSVNDDKMMEFVVTDLSNMIKLSSPMSQSSGSPRSVTSSMSGWSSSSASGWSYSGISRSPSVLTASPEDMPPVDPRALLDLEQQAVAVAGSLDHMLGTLSSSLQRMSSLTTRCLDAYGDGVDGTCDAADAGIRAMYRLMARCEELSAAVQPVHALHTNVRNIKRVLELFENQLAKEEL